MRMLAAVSWLLLVWSAQANTFAGSIKDGKRNLVYLGKFAFGFDSELPLTPQTMTTATPRDGLC